VAPLKSMTTMAGLDMMPLECVDKVEPSNILPQTVGAIRAYGIPTTGDNNGEF